jgi:hypothetical protein
LTLLFRFPILPVANQGCVDASKRSLSRITALPFTFCGEPVPKKERIMKCPHCEEEITGSLCPRCKEATVFDEADYCMACGAPLKEDLPEIPQNGLSDADDGFDLDDRVLCPDGACTGIIIDGTCTECGRRVGPDGEFVEPEETRESPAEPVGEEAEAKKVD